MFKINLLSFMGSSGSAFKLAIKDSKDPPSLQLSRENGAKETCYGHSMGNVLISQWPWVDPTMKLGRSVPESEGDTLLKRPNIR